MMIGNTSNTINMTYNAITATNRAIEKTSRALSTGLKAAMAVDDASGFAMGLAMSAQVAGVDRAIRNSQDGVSMLQTAEGGLSQINSVLQRMRELSVQAANDTLTAQDRQYIQKEIDELRKSVDSAAATTTFNGKRLLDGSSTAQWTSDNAATKLKVTGAITAIDNFGQKKATEGNYKIEIRAKPGQGQVQKSSIIDLEAIEDETLTLDTEAGNTKTVTEKRLHPATLEKIKSFTNASGVSYFTEPQTIRITQGDGKTANIVVYGGDTVYDVRRKINDAIADDLGQGQYVDNRENFCTISDGTPATSESVSTKNPTLTPSYDTEELTYERNADGKLVLDDNGYPKGIWTPVQTEKASIVIRSAVAGKAGELTFSCDNEDLINALGLSTIQEAEENTFTASIYDAHTGKVLAKNVATDGNVIRGEIHPNANIEFDNMANVKVSWDEGSKRYVMTSEDDAYETTLHIQDRSTAFQIGQNRGDDIYINIGDMRSESLGIDAVDVTTRANASRSI
ncbi:MAG: flagellin, partial [Synergistaceae bacterium]|nr:flagellin [Synergistaceae bacterium]